MPVRTVHGTGFVYILLYSSGRKYISFALDSVAYTVCHYHQEAYLYRRRAISYMSMYTNVKYILSYKYNEYVYKC